MSLFSAFDNVAKLSKTALNLANDANSLSMIKNAYDAKNATNEDLLLLANRRNYCSIQFQSYQAQIMIIGIGIPFLIILLMVLIMKTVDYFKIKLNEKSQKVFTVPIIISFMWIVGGIPYMWYLKNKWALKQYYINTSKEIDIENCKKYY